MWRRRAHFHFIVAVLLPGSATLARAQTPDTISADTLVAKLEPLLILSSILPHTGPSIRSGLPARVRIFSRSALTAGRPGLLSDALARQADFTFYDDLGSSFKRTLLTRGFAASPVVGVPQGVTVFLDGVPVNEPDAGQVNFDVLPFEHADAIEVLSGTAAVLGPNSLGGAVNLITGRGAETSRGAAEFSVGSYGARELNAHVGGPLGAIRFYAGGMHAAEDGWRAFTAASRSSLLFNLHGDAARRGWMVQVLGAQARAETAGSLPHSVLVVNPDSNLSAGDFEDLEQLHAATAAYTRLGQARLSARLYYRRHRAERLNVNQINDPDVRSFSANGSAGARVEWLYPVPMLADRLLLRAGAGASAHSTRVRIFAERINAGLTTDVQSPIRKADAFAALGYADTRLTASAALRYDLVRIPFQDRLDPSADTLNILERWSPSVGISVSASGALDVYASIGSSFRAPALIELACADPNEPCPLPFALGDDPPLEPVTATTYEVGAQLDRGWLRLASSLYRTNVHNDIYLFPYDETSEPTGSTIDGFFDNLPTTRREGFEVSLDATLLTRLQLAAAYVFTHATFQTGGLELFSIREGAGGENEIEPGDRLPMIPAHRANLSTRVSVSQQLAFTAQSSYVGKRYLRGDEANVEPPLAGNVVVDAEATLRRTDWEVSVGVRNVLDRSYATFGTFNFNQGSGGVFERFLSPGDPRTYYITLTRRFGEE